MEKVKSTRVSRCKLCHAKITGCGSRGKIKRYAVVLREEDGMRVDAVNRCSRTPVSAHINEQQFLSLIPEYWGQQESDASLF